ncbi:MAG TPA: HAD family phosphatase [Kofleriaceae bacterium]|jgi:HAD superfamily hydrolase (TIGR01509 family)|nr:HAD family phosphatase [Kofleriaceae bacterium]
MPVRAVLFDLDGTLVDSERQYGEAMARALVTGLGIAITDEDRAFSIGRSWVAIHDRLRTVYPALTWARDELIHRTALASHEVFAEQGVWVLPGAIEAIARFADRARGIVTGSSRVECAAMLERLGVAAAFGIVLCAEDVPRSKPAPDGYLAACARLGVAPHEAVVLEDSAAGIAAARAAGCAVIAVAAGNFAGQDQSAAHHRAATLDEVTHDLIERVAAALAGGYGRETNR